MSVIGRNMLWLFVSQVLTWMISVVVLIVSPDRLGASNFGLLNFTAAFIGFFTFAGLLGTGPYLIKTVARDPDTLGAYVYNAVILKVLVAFVLGALALGLGLALGYSGTAMALIGIGVFGMLLALLNDVATSSLAGVNRMARPAAWQVIQTYLTAALALFALFTHMGVVAFASAYVIGAIIPVLANIKNAWQFVADHTHIDFTVWRRIIRGGLPLLVLSGLILIYGTVDIPLLEALTNNETVGRYALAYRWVSIPVFVATIVVGASTPSLSAFAQEQSERFVSLANRSLRLVIAVSIPAATGVVIVAYDLMDLLYNQGFEGTALLIRILAVHIPLAAISTVLGAILIASDRQNRYAITALIAAIANPPLTVLLIQLSKHWWHNGAIGAAVVTVLTEIFMVVGAFRLRRPGIFDRETKSFAARCIAANVLMAVPLLVLSELELFIKAVIGVVLYVLASLLFRTIRLADVRKAVDQFRGTGRPGGRRNENEEVMEHVLPDDK
ncbi:MAG: Polysaccharide biosynthesis protein [Ilumatobacteraceae bacterium]|nr:Polysaccharide biosynthesis protein [Ilumatobacteraceae bacterium]